MRRLKYSLQAREDFADIAEYIANESGSRKIAEAFIRKLKTKCRRLADLPGTFGVARDEYAAGLRSTPYNRFVIFFRYDGDSLEITTIVHGARDYNTVFENPVT